MLDFLLGFLTPAPFDLSETFSMLQYLDEQFYLVEHDENQFLVKVTDEFIETKKILVPITTEKFEIGNWKYMNCGEVIARERKKSAKKRK